MEARIERDRVPRRSVGGVHLYERWQIVNDDGTGNTTWLTISRASGYGAGDGDPSAIMYSFLESDTEIATTVRELGTPTRTHG